ATAQAVNWIENRPDSQCERVVTSGGIAPPAESARLIVSPARLVAATVDLPGHTAMLAAAPLSPRRRMVKQTRRPSLIPLLSGVWFTIACGQAPAVAAE